MFLYNILTGGSSKQEQSKYDKIAFKINLSDNIPQYYQYNSVQNNKNKYLYEDDQQLTQNHPMWNKVIGYQKKRRNNSQEEQKILEEIEKSNTMDGINKKNGEKRNSDKENHVNEKGSEDRIPQNQEQHHQPNQTKSINSNNKHDQSKQSQSPNSHPAHKYHHYTTTQNDTLFGIALKLDIRQQQIKQLNDISQRLYPGMTIKLPFHCDISKLYDQPEEQLSKVKISQILSFQATNMIQTQKYESQYYAGLAGYIKGMLSINKNYIIFNPDLQDQKNLDNYSVQKLLKFNAIVETIDIQDIAYIDIPQMPDIQSNNDNPEHNHIIQIFLYIVGNPKIQRKYKQRLNKLKNQKKAIASISFSLRSYKTQAKQKSQKIVTKVKDILKILQSEQDKLTNNKKPNNIAKLRQQKSLTNIPFFDIIHQNLHPKIKQQMQSLVMSPQKSFQPLSPSMACGILTQNSDIISDSMFHILSFSLPILYQQCNWTRIYSSTLNGTAFSTLLSKSRDECPLILLVKQYKGWKFGAYLCDSLQTGKTGRGQMFIFTFKNDNQCPQVYKWTNKNQFFVYTEKDAGIGIGMGLKYGIFIKNTMDKGSSAPTFTFGNSQALSKKQDFIIEDVEIWAIDNGY